MLVSIANYVVLKAPISSTAAARVPTNSRVHPHTLVIFYFMSLFTLQLNSYELLPPAIFWTRHKAMVTGASPRRYTPPFSSRIWFIIPTFELFVLVDLIEFSFNSRSRAFC